MEKINDSDDEFYIDLDFDPKSMSKTGKKKKVVDVAQMCDDLEMKLTESFKEHRSEIRKIKKEYQKTVNKLKKSSATGKKKKAVGINNVTRIPDSLADLIGVKRGTEMARTELGKNIHEVFKNRDLLYSSDKRIMRVDDELAKIFGTTTDVNKSTDPKASVDVGFNFYNLQSYIKRCFENSKGDESKTKTIKK